VRSRDGLTDVDDLARSDYSRSTVGPVHVVPGSHSEQIRRAIGSHESDSAGKSPGLESG